MLLGKRAKDLTGHKFGSLIAIKPSHKDTSNTLHWEFKCDCGATHVARGNVISNQAKKNIPNIPSCGCVELRNKTKHGFRTSTNTHPAYRVYRGIMSRCYDVNTYTYKWYGAVGVTICSQWKDNPEAFVKWAINNGWKPGLHIDKDIICEEKNISPHIYSPETCQWITAKVNVGFATNRSNFGKHPNVKLSQAKVDEIELKYFSGQETNMSELARNYGVNPSSIRKILKLAKQ